MLIIKYLNCKGNYCECRIIEKQLNEILKGCELENYTIIEIEYILF